MTFPKWLNRLPVIVALVAVGAVLGAIGGFWYWGSPEFLAVGYAPVQPVPYSHQQHAGQFGMDCRYCHHNVERSPHANVPANQTCMNCHNAIKADSQKLVAVRESYANEVPVEWVRIHKVPDYARFPHHVHLAKGVGCAACHGRIDRMKVVHQAEPLSMGWCLECHREPQNYLQPRETITDMDWSPGAPRSQLGEQLVREYDVNPPENCSACHY